MKQQSMNKRTVRLGTTVAAVASGLALYALAAQLDLTELLAGNARFSSGIMEHPNQTIERRLEVAHGQHPHTIVLTCADSRVAPEILFDQGLGDLFVVRVAGNVVDAHTLASMEYAVEHLHCSQLVVMGHERCGAVQAAVEAVLHPAPVPRYVKEHRNANDNLDQLLDAIKPAVQDALQSNPVDLVDAAVRMNIENTMSEIRKRSVILSEKLDLNELSMEGVYYDLDDGTVTAP